MSTLNDAISKSTAQRLAELTADDVKIIAKTMALGFIPETIPDAYARVARGEAVQLASELGRAKPLKINAWSFVSDSGQYYETYGISPIRAAELKNQLTEDPNVAIEAITALVTAKQRQRNTQKAVIVSLDGMPANTRDARREGVVAGDEASQYAEIRQRGQMYGMYDFTAERLPSKIGQFASYVNLGEGLRAYGKNDKQAIAVARICRVQSRQHELVKDYIGFVYNGNGPVFGKSIPTKIPDGKQHSDSKLRADPIEKARTVKE